MRVIEGYFDQILNSTPNKKESQDFIFFSLLDHTLIPNAMNRLRAVYPNALGLFTKYRAGTDLSVPSQKAAKPIDLLFQEFYRSVTGEKTEAEQDAVIQKICRKLQAGDDTNETNPTGI